MAAAASCLPAQQPGCERERARLEARFGNQVEFVKAQQPCAVIGDFNRDGTMDVAMLARASAAEFSPAVTVANPWKKPASRPAVRPKKGALLLAVVLEGPVPKLFLLADAEFFATPMWTQPVKLISKLARPKSADRIAVATEGGPDVQLYWTGSAWRLEIPNEEP